MAGRFEGLSDQSLQLFADIFPSEPSKRGKGMNLQRKGVELQ